MLYKNGFAFLPLIILVLVLGTAGAVVIVKLNSHSNQQAPASNTPSIKSSHSPAQKSEEIQGEDPAKKAYYQSLGGSKSETNENCSNQVTFSSPLTNINSISKITPGSGTGDSRYTYLWIKGSQPVPIYAPADGTLIKITYKTRTDLPENMSKPDYDLAFQTGCNTMFVINHVTDPIEEIASTKPVSGPIQLKPGSGVNDKDTKPTKAVQVKAGEQIGTTTGTPSARNFDFGAFVNNQAVCPYEKFPENISKNWLALFGGEKCEVGGGL